MKTKGRNASTVKFCVSEQRWKTNFYNKITGKNKTQNTSLDANVNKKRLNCFLH